MVKMRALYALCVISLLAGAPPLAAQTYPAKTIRMVVPFAVGGTSDVLARLIGQHLGEALGRRW